MSQMLQIYVTIQKCYPPHNAQELAHWNVLTAQAPGTD